MQIRQAYSFAEELTALKFFPSNASGIAKISEIIADLCADEIQARILIDEMCKKFDEWPGPVTLRLLYNDLFVVVRESEWEPGYSPPPLPNCDRCGDIGFYKHQDTYLRCDCPPSVCIPDEILADFNRWQSTRSMPEIMRKKEPIQ